MLVNGTCKNPDRRYLIVKVSYQGIYEQILKNDWVERNDIFIMLCLIALSKFLIRLFKLYKKLLEIYLNYLQILENQE